MQILFDISGFHSQLVAFENAIMMAYYTNRTLLAPMLRLGASFDFAPFDGLRHSYLTQDVNNQEATLIPWSSLFDLQPLLNNYNVRILEKTEGPSDGISDTYLGANPSPDMIHFVNSSQELRSWKLYDNENNASPLGAYKEKWTLQQVRNIDKPLLYFGSMFGRGRVMATVPEHQVFQRFLRQQFKIIHPGLKETADRIIEVLGGPSQYVGLQLLSPASGKVKQQHVIEESIQSLLTELDLDEMQMGDNEAAGRDCLDDQQSPKLYLATDLTLPASNPVLTRLRRLFPCTIAYQDLVTWDLLNDKLQDVKDDQGKNVGHFYIPLVDGIVASRGKTHFCRTSPRLIFLMHTELTAIAFFSRKVLWTTRQWLWPVLPASLAIGALVALYLDFLAYFLNIFVFNFFHCNCSPLHFSCLLFVFLFFRNTLFYKTIGQIFDIIMSSSPWASPVNVLLFLNGIFHKPQSFFVILNFLPCLIC